LNSEKIQSAGIGTYHWDCEIQQKIWCSDIIESDDYIIKTGVVSPNQKMTYSQFTFTTPFSFLYQSNYYEEWSKPI